MSNDTLAAPPTTEPLRYPIAAVPRILAALSLVASAVFRLLSAVPFAVQCSTSLLFRTSNDPGAARVVAFAIAVVEVLIGGGLFATRLRGIAKVAAAVEIVLVAIVASILAQPELIWAAVGLAPLNLLLASHSALVLVAAAYALLLAGAFLTDEQPEQIAA